MVRIVEHKSRDTSLSWPVHRLTLLVDDNLWFRLTCSVVAAFVADATFDAAHDGVLQGDDADGGHDDDGAGNL